MSLPAIKMRHDISVYVVILGVRDAFAHAKDKAPPLAISSLSYWSYSPCALPTPPFHCIAHQSVD